MLVLEVEYLTGRVVATSHNDRETAEWPPHPARLFSALVAVYEQEDEPNPRHRQALDWLAAQPAPRICASNVSRRAVHTHYVPVNDTSVLGHSAIERSINTLRSLEAELSEASTDKQRARIEKKVAKQREKLEKDARREASKVDKSKEPSLSVLPVHRKKQSRTFPSLTPEDPRVQFVWDGQADEATERDIDELVRSLVRLGHSSSPVRARVLDHLPDGVEPNWNPDPDGPEYLRVPVTDQLRRLEDAYALHRAVSPRLLPFRWQRYRQGAAVTKHETDKHTLFSSDGWIVFERTDGPRGRKDTARYLPMLAAAKLSQSVRDALVLFADQAGVELSEAITGHTPDGKPSQGAHMAIIPLPYVGAKYADGMIRGFALVLPRGVDERARTALLRTIGQWETTAKLELAAYNEDAEIPSVPVQLGRAGVAYFTRLLHESNMTSLRSKRWTAPSRTWRSVTPVALDRNPGNLHAESLSKVRQAAQRAEQSVQRACERVGLPQPIEVDVRFAPGVTGTEHATRYPPFPGKQRTGKPRRVLIHVALRFEEPVQGPMMLGAGRYYGLGLMLPMQEEEHDA